MSTNLFEDERDAPAERDAGTDNTASDAGTTGTTGIDLTSGGEIASKSAEVLEVSTPVFSLTVVVILTCVLLFLSLLLLWLVTHFRKRRRQRQRGHHRRRLHRGKIRTETVQELQRMASRYNTIESWLCTKWVLEHDTFCERRVCELLVQEVNACQACSECAADNGETGRSQQWIEQAEKCECRLVQPKKEPHKVKTVTTDQVDYPCACGAKESSNDLKSTPSSDTRETDDSSTRKGECAICMEPMVEGDVVSWSSNCSHVFHHICVKEWLLRHVHCPCCRSTYLLIDQYRGHAKYDHLRQMQQQHKLCEATSFYCQRDGLRRIPLVVRCTKNDLKRLEKRLLTCVPRHELEQMRRTITTATDKGGTNVQDLDLEASTSGVEVTAMRRVISDGDSTSSDSHHGVNDEAEGINSGDLASAHFDVRVRQRDMAMDSAYDEDARIDGELVQQMENDADGSNFMGEIRIIRTVRDDDGDESSE